MFAATSADALNLDINLATWAGLAVIITVMAIFDLVIYARGHVPSVRENTIWSIGWIAVALLFGAFFWAWQGSEAGSQFYAGYLLERSLSLDNIFVFAVILSYFAVPGLQAQARVLAWGIMLALFLRLIFILLGAALLDAFHITFYVFGAQDKEGNALPKGNNCVTCHVGHGAFDGTFAQFYPTIRDRIPKDALERALKDHDIR